MNYLQEIIAFNTLVSALGLSPVEQALWHALMAMANTLHWPQEFSVRTTALLNHVNCDRRTLYRARERLVELGRIVINDDAESGICCYEIVPIVSAEIQPETDSVTEQEQKCTSCDAYMHGKTAIVGQNVSKNATDLSHHSTGNTSSPFSSPLVSPLPSPTPPTNPPIIPPTQPPVVVADAPTDIVKPEVKQADAFVGSTDQPDNNDYDDGGEFGLTSDEIEQHRRLIERLEAKAKDYGLPWHIGDINRTVDWCGEYSPDWVLLAIDRASMRERRSWGLVKGILKSWQSRGAPDGLEPSGGVDDRPPVISD